MSKKKKKEDFWRLIAKAYISGNNALDAEFERHNETIRKIIIQMQVDRKPKG